MAILAQCLSYICITKNYNAMIFKLSIILLLAAFIVLMAYWVVRTEEKPKGKRSLLDPKKTYNKARELGLEFPGEFNEVLPGV